MSWQVIESKVSAALVRVRQVLEEAKHPVLASAKEASYHVYEDKYMLADFLGNAAIAAHINILSSLGLREKDLRRAITWASDEGRSVTLRLNAHEKCKFNREVTREEDSKTKHVTEIGSGAAKLLSFSSKVVTTITEYFYDYELFYSLELYRGTGENESDRIVFRERRAHHEIMTSVKDVSPKPASVVRPGVEVEMTWLFKHVKKDSLSATFFIDRHHEDCHTPRRNRDVHDHLTFLWNWRRWSEAVSSYFMNSVFPIPVNHGLDVKSINAEGVFVPVLPLLQPRQDADYNLKAIEAEAEAGGEEGSKDTTIALSLSVSANDGEKDLAVLPVSTLNLFLTEEVRSLELKCNDMRRVFPAGNDITNNGLITSEEASLLVILYHSNDVVLYHSQSVDYIEEMLRRQLIAAIGREVTPTDLSEYMKFHNNKIFQEAYRPRPFCYAIRRSSDHSPEGVLSVELKDGGRDSGPNGSDVPDPIFTIVRHDVSTSLETYMSFNLSASTSIKFGGDRYLHTWLQHSFSGNAGGSRRELTLVADARQFSGYIVLIGRINSATSFDPKYAMIVKDKDSVRIPLNLETIPSAKEFKDAISSLSPEQQAFAKAFRSMQLESTLFGVCVIQIKPQLEKVLKLTPDSLTKEIKLTQDLMELFIEYQIPSDLLSFDGNDHADRVVRLGRVKELVKAMQDMIGSFKAKELAEVEQKAVYNVFDAFDDVKQLQQQGSVLELSPQLRTQSRSLSSRSFGSGSMNSVSFSGPPPPPPPCAAIVPMPPPAPQPQLQQQQQQPPMLQQPLPRKPTIDNAVEIGLNSPEIVYNKDLGTIIDYTKIPAELDSQFENHAKGSVIRPTIIHPGETWVRRRFASLLSKASESNVDSDELKREKNKAYDLLDALTKSGGLSVDAGAASFHVIIAATHNFDKTVMNTLIEDNVNPIEKVERATLIMAKTVHRVDGINELVTSETLTRLLGDGNDDGNNDKTGFKQLLLRNK